MCEDAPCCGCCGWEGTDIYLSDDDNGWEW